MNESRISKLTKREHEFLLLFARPMLIKEIAFQCGVAEVTVNKALESARKKLNVRSSREAARLVTELQGYSKTVGQPQSLGMAEFPAMLQGSSSDGEWPAVESPIVVQEEQRAYLTSYPPTRLSWSSILDLVGDRHDLTLRQKALIIVLLATAIIIAAGTLVTIGRGLSHSVAAAVRALS